MKRHIWGVLAATVVAPYLTAFLWCLLGFAAGGIYGVKEPFDILKAIPLGTFGLLLFGTPLLVFTSLCAALVNAMGARSWHISVLSGAIPGLGFMIALYVRTLDYDKDAAILLISGLVSGAICGWIYWRIAIKSCSSLGSPTRGEAI